MAYNPFSGVRITGTWEDHASYSAGGTDLPLGYGTPIPAPGTGVLRISGGSGEWACGWVGSAGRRSILTLATPLARHTPRKSSPPEGDGPLTAIVFQHQSNFNLAGGYAQGQTVGWTGASANGSNYGGDVHLHWHGLNANGQRLRLESFLPTGLAGGGVTPIPEEELIMALAGAMEIIYNKDIGFMIVGPAFVYEIGNQDGVDGAKKLAAFRGKLGIEQTDVSIEEYNIIRIVLLGNQAAIGTAKYTATLVNSAPGSVGPNEYVIVPGA